MARNTIGSPTLKEEQTMRITGVGTNPPIIDASQAATINRGIRFDQGAGATKVSNSGTVFGGNMTSAAQGAAMLVVLQITKDNGNQPPIPGSGQTGQLIDRLA